MLSVSEDILSAAMIDLPIRIPDVDLLLALQPEELASRLLFLFQERSKKEGGWMPHFESLESGPFARRQDGVAPYDQKRKDDIILALAEAWAWLEAQGLLLPAPGGNGRNGYRVLSRRARAFSDPREFTNFTTARRLPKEALDPRIADTVWQAFMRAEYDVAVFQAMKAVEVTVRVAANLGAKDIGTTLMRKAFDPENGQLTDTSVEKGERQALSDLFAGAIGSYKNPHSHRDLNLDDPAEAIEIVMLANHLLRVVNARCEARTAGQP